MFVSAEKFINFLFRLNESSGMFDEIIIPYRQAGTSNINWGKLDRKRADEISLNSFRTILPLKFLFYPPRETVYPEKSFYPKRLIVGVKACDLVSLEILDAALLHANFIEPSYSRWRENTTLISVDCSEITSSCHCDTLQGNPFPEKGFDINISPVNGKYFLTADSEKGKVLLEQIKQEVKVFNPDTQDMLNLEEKRKFTIHLLKQQNQHYYNGNNSGTPEIRHSSEDKWKMESKECVGCGACTNVCPTCYCLILNDESMSDEFIKVRTYDSCQWFGYARVAGGGTPRPKMHERFRNRYLCKFDYMQSNFQKPGCTGCGRCIDACTAGIDFRQVLKKVKTEPESILFNQ